MYMSGAIVAFFIGFIGSLVQANWRRNDLNEDESLAYSYFTSVIGGVIWGIFSWVGAALALIVYYKWYKNNCD